MPDTAAAGVGPQLRAARERRGLTIDQVAAETRISERHLEHIEAGEFDALPGRTYAVGFAKTYAKTVGLDTADVAAMVREEMNVERPSERYGANRAGTFEPGDPNRSPGGRLVWFSLFAIILLAVGIFFAARVLFAPAADLPSLVEQEEAERAAQLAAQREREQQQAEPVDATGDVVFTAQGDAWVRFYDAQGRVLSEQTLSEGDTYTVPSDANGPQLLTGRPDLLAITIGGREVRKISNELETVSDVPVTAEALLARGGSGAGAGAGSAVGQGEPNAAPAPSAPALPAASPTPAT
ncbi:helix-turn-helix domain-containing protein [Aurantiacibacter spongiae]|uniref:Helix-turn-helix domain-containing protein n=2 Tax=Aurantiacibacter spongiae TaxID=2488860 RepID=A0A3N5DD61_9SPHN|nr:helix-turn-helix domain-containing protein [Aurantiacibacter spongiae]